MMNLVVWSKETRIKSFKNRDDSSMTKRNLSPKSKEPQQTYNGEKYEEKFLACPCKADRLKLQYTHTKLSSHM